MFRFGLFNSNNTSASGATLLRCSLFLAISVNNTQSIVCGGLEKHLPWPSGGDPVYLIEAAVSKQCLPGILSLSPFARPTAAPQKNTHLHVHNKGRELAFVTACALLGNSKRGEESRRLVWSLAKSAYLDWPRFRGTFAHISYSNEVIKSNKRRPWLKHSPVWRCYLCSSDWWFLWWTSHSLCIQTSSWTIASLIAMGLSLKPDKHFGKMDININIYIYMVS